VQEQKKVMAAVVALAGRRVDAVGTNPPRFPLENVPLVRKRLAEVLVTKGAAAFVRSAACGADSVALEEAARLGLRRRIVLPFREARFRETSVIDRPGDWGPVFDRFVTTAEAAGDLIVLDGGGGDDEAAYADANDAIIIEAKRLAEAGAPPRLIAIVVWEGAARAGNDATESFRNLAAKSGFEQRFMVTF